MRISDWSSDVCSSDLVVPVTQPMRFMAHGWFDHAAHKQEHCGSCHAANRSKTSADVLLPGIKQCLTCHAGESSAAKDKVASSCAMCHGYHTTAIGSEKRSEEHTSELQSLIRSSYA